MKIVDILYSKPKNCFWIDDSNGNWVSSCVPQAFKIRTYYPEAYFNSFRRNGFLTTTHTFCAWDSRILFFNQSITDFSSHILDFISPKIAMIRTGQNDLEVILKFKKFTSHYIDFDTNYLVYYDETFEAKSIDFNYNLLKVYEGNEFWQKKQLSQEMLSLFVPIDKLNFDLYFIYEITTETGESFNVSITVTTPEALMYSYQKILGKDKLYELSYPFILTPFFELETILQFIKQTFEQVKASSVTELMLKLGSIMSVEQADFLQTVPIAQGEILSFNLTFE
jgi:hypothetical protein